jgi:hypothetical protein
MNKAELLARTRPEGDCLVWTGAKTDNGYGRLKINAKYQRAHRVSYSLHNGPIAEGLIVLHTCDVRLCCNPAHLVLGTHADNMADMKNKGRAARGANHGNVRLTAEQVREARRLYRPRSLEHSGTALARRYGVSASTISYAMSERHWAHLSE